MLRLNQRKAGRSDPASGPALSQYESRRIATEVPASPFSMPLPAFDTAIPSFQPLFPAFSSAPAFPAEEFAATASKSASSFYFLEEAGTLSKPSVAPDLHLPRQQFDVGSVRRD